MRYCRVTNETYKLEWYTIFGKSASKVRYDSSTHLYSEVNIEQWSDINTKMKKSTGKSNILCGRIRTKEQPCTIGEMWKRPRNTECITLATLYHSKFSTYSSLINYYKFSVQTHAATQHRHITIEWRWKQPLYLTRFDSIKYSMYRLVFYFTCTPPNVWADTKTIGYEYSSNHNPFVLIEWIAI